MIIASLLVPLIGLMIIVYHLPLVFLQRITWRKQPCRIQFGHARYHEYHNQSIEHYALYARLTAVPVDTAQGVPRGQEAKSIVINVFPARVDNLFPTVDMLRLSLRDHLAQHTLTFQPFAPAHTVSRIPAARAPTAGRPLMCTELAETDVIAAGLATTYYDHPVFFWVRFIWPQMTPAGRSIVLTHFGIGIGLVVLGVVLPSLVMYWR